MNLNQHPIKLPRPWNQGNLVGCLLAIGGLLIFGVSLASEKSERT